MKRQQAHQYLFPPDGSVDDCPDIGLLEFVGLIICAFAVVVGFWALAVFYLVTFG